MHIGHPSAKGAKAKESTLENISKVYFTRDVLLLSRGRPHNYLVSRLHGLIDYNRYIHTFYIHYITLHYMHCIHFSHCTSYIHCIAPNYTRLDYIKLHYMKLNYVTLHTYHTLKYIIYITFHYIALPYIHHMRNIPKHTVTNNNIGKHSITYHHTPEHTMTYHDIP